MTLSHQKFREIVLQLLYSQEVAHPGEELVIPLMMNELSVPKSQVKLAYDKVLKIDGLTSEIDPLITSVSTSYDIERIQLVTKMILRLAIYELLFEKEVPPKVIIAEAIRLSRKFSSPESAAFVNAIVDKLYHAD